MIATDIDTSNVTDAQIGMAHMCFEGSKPFYKVENSRGELDQDGHLIEYKVTFSKEHSFQCTCKAGKEGFAHCRNYCWHVRAAVACAREERAAMREQTLLSLEPTMPVVEMPAHPVVSANPVYTDVDGVTLARVIRRSQEQEGKPTKRVPLRSGRAFSILK